MGDDSILTKINQLETNLKNEIKNESRFVKIGIPLIVAVIAFLASYCTSMKQTELNNKLQKEINAEQAKQNNELEQKLTRYQATLTSYIESQKHIQEAKATFYKDVKAMLALIDTEFEGLANFTYKKKNDKLTNALDKLERLKSEAPATTDIELLGKLGKYSNFIFDKWREFDKIPNDTEYRKQALNESRGLLEDAKRALEKLLPTSLAPK